MDEEEKKRCFTFHDDGIGQDVIFDDIDDLMAYLKTYVDALGEDQIFELEVQRHDLTQAQFDALPESEV